MCLCLGALGRSVRRVRGGALNGPCAVTETSSLRDAKTDLGGKFGFL